MDFLIQEKDDLLHLVLQGKIIPLKSVFIEKRITPKRRSSGIKKQLCFRLSNLRNILSRKIQHQEKNLRPTPIIRSQYERNIARVEVYQGRYMERKTTKAPLEPVFWHSGHSLWV